MSGTIDPDATASAAASAQAQLASTATSSDAVASAAAAAQAQFGSTTASPDATAAAAALAQAQILQGVLASASVAPTPASAAPGYVTLAGGLNRVYDGVEALLPGVQHPLVMLETFSALEEFCLRSTWWQELVNWTLQPGSALLDFSTLISAGAPAWILQVNGLQRGQFLPTIQCLDTGDITMFRTGTALIAIRPTQLTDATIPALLIAQWSDAIRDGVMARLCAHPGKPYSSPQMAQMCMTRFRQAIRQARATSTRFGLVRQRRFPYFAGGRQYGCGSGVGTGGWAGASGQAYGNGDGAGFVANQAVFDDTNADETLLS